MNWRKKTGLAGRRCLLLIAITAAFVSGARAQINFEGCVDARGIPVASIPAPGLNDIAAAALDRFGRPVIYYNPGAFQYGRLIRLFFYTHECGHHALGHTFVSRPVTQEQEADCWAIRTLVQKGLVSDSEMIQIQMTIARFGRGDWTHVPGPQRAINLRHCLAGEAPDSGQPQDAGGDDNSGARYESQGPGDDSNFASALRSVIRAAPNAFRAVRGRRDPDDNDDDTPSYDASRNLPGAKGTCDVFGGTSPSYVCTMFRGKDHDDAGSVYDHCIDQVRTAVRGWRWSDITRRSVEQGRRAEGSDGTNIRVEMTERSGYYSVKVWVDGPE